MSSQCFQNQIAQLLWTEDLKQVPQTFAEAIAHLKAVILQEFDREVAEKQLCYHTREHIAGVERRASQIFQVIRPYLQPSDDPDRLKLLLDLCAVAHDLIQIFIPQLESYTTRRREVGVSETATVEKLFEYINIVNQQYPDYSHHLSEGDFQIIRQAIAATICDYDLTEQAIFQPALGDREQPISLIARILALADIGTLGMEGTEAYNLEGSLLFLEENPDVRSLIENHQLESLIVDNLDLHENIRQRLLRRARFQVNFSKSRLKRCPQELEAFPVEAIPSLTNEVFQYLTPETIQAIESTTPTAADTPLEVLTDFFRFDQVVARMAS
jgi:hypothetical protein